MGDMLCMTCDFLLQLQSQLHVHDAPLSLAELSRIAVDAGARVSDGDSQVLLMCDV